MKSNHWILCLLILILLLTGCSDTAETTTEYGYMATEILIPNPDSELPQKQGTFEECCYRIENETIYRISKVTENLEANRVAITRYIQICQAPYDKWDTYALDLSIEVDGQETVIYNQCVSPKGEIYLLTSPDGNEFWLVKWTKEQVILEQKFPWTSMLNSMSWEMDIEGTSYFYNHDSFEVYDKNFKQQPQNLEKIRIQKLVFAADGKLKGVLGYSATDSKLNIFSLPDNEACMPKEMLSNSSFADACYIGAEDGAILIAETGRLYSASEMLLAPLVTWDSQNIVVDTIEDIGFGSDGSILLLATWNGQRELMRLQEGFWDINQEVKELKLVALASLDLHKAVALFNKSHPDYHITLQSYDENEMSFEEFCTQLQLEISAKKGPDIVDVSMIDLYNYSREGYLEPIDEDRIDAKAELYSNAYACGMVDGRQYMVPYAFYIQSMYALQNVGLQSGYNLQDLFTSAETKKPGAISGGCVAGAVLYDCVCRDEEATQFIDWEQMECHFDTAEFIKVLEFAKQYEDTETRDFFMRYDDLLKNEYLLQRRDVSSVESLSSLLNESKDITFVGFPTQSGKGHFVTGIGFSVTSFCENKEGAFAFLNFLLTPTLQEMLTTEDLFPINTEVLKEQLKSEKMAVGILEDILEDAVPVSTKYAAVTDIILQEAETYFEGHLAAEEVANRIQNRVSLYLNENK